MTGTMFGTFLVSLAGDYAARVRLTGSSSSASALDASLRELREALA